MYTPVAWTKSINPTAALTALDAVADETHATKDAYVYVGVLAYIIAMRAGGERIRRAVLSSPELRRIFPHHIWPLATEDEQQAALAVDWRTLSPLPLKEGEGVGVKVLNDTTPATSHDYWLMALMADGPVTPVTGAIHTVRFTTTGAPVAKKWSSLTITLDETLPAGRYQVVGADLRSGSGIGFRFVPVGEVGRPGGFTHWMYGAQVAQQRMGNLGVWFEFEHRTPPTLEIFEMGTEEPSFGYLDLISLAT